LWIKREIEHNIKDDGAGKVDDGSPRPEMIGRGHHKARKWERTTLGLDVSSDTPASQLRR